MLSSAASPPKSRRDNVRENLHGVEVVDPYRWLEERHSRETEAWIDAQNRHTRAYLDVYPGREPLRRRLSELMRVEEFSLPIVRKGSYFLRNRAAAAEQAVLVLRKGLNGDEKVLVDPKSFGPNENTSVGWSDVSEDGDLAAYWVRAGGQDETRVRFLRVSTGQHLPDELPAGRYPSVAILPDNNGYYYVRMKGEERTLLFHRFGTSFSTDRELFGRGLPPEHYLSCAVSDNGRWLIIVVSKGWDKNDLYVQNLASGGPAVAVAKNLDGLFHGQFAGDRLMVMTTWRAPKGRILEIDPADPAPGKWRVVVPESEHVIDGLYLAGGRLLVQYLENVQARIKVFSPSGKHLRDIALPAIGTVPGVSSRWDEPEFFFEFSSFHIPPQIHRVETASWKSSLWRRTSVPIRSDDFDVRQVWYRSKDGTRVPMFLLSKKDPALDGERPTLLRGYGGFSSSMTPEFRPDAILMAENGGVFAVANLRGGSEFGEQWHKAGMFEKKQNVFDDFIAAAEYLIRNRYTSPGRLAITGRSNGGLLVGAALIQRPDLFQAVLCGYPLLDMVRYHRFLIAKLWVPEYGSAEDPEQFRYLYAYSPYHRVGKGVRYPAVLIVTGDGDTRVDPLHGRKMAALLQSSTGWDRPVLLRYDTQAGHSAGVSTSKLIEERLDEMTFLFAQLGVTLGR